MSDIVTVITGRVIATSHKSLKPKYLTDVDKDLKFNFIYKIRKESYL